MALELAKAVAALVGVMGGDCATIDNRFMSHIYAIESQCMTMMTLTSTVVLVLVAVLMISSSVARQTYRHANVHW